MKKTNQVFAWSRLLCLLMALVMVMGLVLCGCKKEEAGNGDNGIVLGDGDGNFEAEDVVGGVTSVYGTLLNALGSGVNKEGGYALEMGLNVGQSTLDQIRDILDAEGMDLDISWLNKISIGMDAAWNEKMQSEVLIAAKLNGTSILSIKGIVDMANSMGYVAFPELSDRFVGMEYDADLLSSVLPQELASIMGEAVGTMGSSQEIMDQYSELIEALPSESELNSLLNRYVDIAIKALGEPIKSEQTLSYGGISQKVTTNTYVIDRAGVVNAVVKILETARKDKQLETILDNFGKALNNMMEDQLGGLFWTDVDLYAMLAESIDMLLADYEQVKDDLINEELMRYTVYKDGNDQAGFALQMDGMELFHCYNLTNGSNTAFELNVGDEFVVVGTGTNAGNKANGTYSINVQGEEVLVVEVKNFDTEALRRGNLKGTLRLKMGKTLEDQMSYDDAYGAMDSAAIGIMGMTGFDALELVLDIRDEVANVEYNLYNKDTFIGGIFLNAGSAASHKITVPSSYVDLNDMNQLQDYVLSLDFNRILANLTKAGVSPELVEMLEYAVQGAFWGGV